MIRPHRSPRGLTLTAAAALVLTAACGGDDNDDGSEDDPADTVDVSDDETEQTSEASADDETGDASGGAEAAPAASGEPSTLLADALHPLDLPDPGTAVWTLAGETYVFDDLGNCRIAETAEGRWDFVATGTAELADGTRTSFNVTRNLVEADQVTEGTWHERDFLQLTVEQEPDAEMFSNAIHDVYREVPGGPIAGDGEEMPVIRVIDDGGVVAATAVVEMALSVSTVDRAGEGIGEFAVVCE